MHHRVVVYDDELMMVHASNESEGEHALILNCNLWRTGNLLVNLEVGDVLQTVLGTCIRKFSAWAFYLYEKTT